MRNEKLKFKWDIKSPLNLKLPDRYTGRLCHMRSYDNKIRSFGVTYPFYTVWRNHCQEFCWGEKSALLSQLGSLTQRTIKQSETLEKIISPLDIARQYQNALNQPDIKTKAQVAKLFKVSRARVTQYLNLLKLPKHITDFIDANRNNPQILRRFSERRLRTLTQLKDEKEQLDQFSEMISMAKDK